jgi:spermidine synthase
MSRAFEELAHESTPMGDISLRRRLEPSLQIDIFEVKLGDEFLMSSLFTAGEEALAEIGLGAYEGERIDVIVGGLGLGYTARKVLEDPRVQTLRVIDALPQVIDWHNRHLIPHAAKLTDDSKCVLEHGHFFELVESGLGSMPAQPQCYDVVLVDIDHSPQHLLHPGHASFYEPEGIRRLAEQLTPGGVFALWSNDPPDDMFIQKLTNEFAKASAQIVSFPNFYLDAESKSTIYVATTAAD